MIPRGPRDPGPVRPDPVRLPAAPTTRFAPAPTELLHLGHLVNALYVWGIAAATGGRVVLRIEDH
ncbi:MAG: glutamate--tRNA ligase family protein, partial [Chloroflexota bacterium]